MDFEQCIEFLNDFVEYASRFFDDSGLNKKIVTESEVSNLVHKIKPQPLTKIRKTIPLVEWRAYGYNSGQDVKKQQELDRWSQFPEASIEESMLYLENASLKRGIDLLSWWFKIKIKLEEGSSCTVILASEGKNAIGIKSFRRRVGDDVWWQ